MERDLEIICKINSEISLQVCSIFFINKQDSFFFVAGSYHFSYMLFILLYMYI